jgi:hypothetical protein
MESSVRCPSPPNTYSYVWEENLCLTRKLVEKFFLFLCITNQFLALHPRSMDGLEEPFSAEKKFLQPTHHLPALISSYLAGDNKLSKKLPTTKDSTI